MSIVRAAVWIGWACLGFGLGAPAVAQPAAGAGMKAPRTAEIEQQARKRAAEGDRFYARKDYPNALEKLEEAYRLDPNPAFKFNLGQIHRALGHEGAAVAAFERFLLDVPDAPARQRQAALRQAQSLRPRLGTVEVVCDVDGAEISVDGQPQGTTPQVQSIWVTPGSHVVLVRVAGTPFGYAQRIDTVAGTTTPVSAQLAPLMTALAVGPTAVPAADRSSWSAPQVDPQRDPAQVNLAGTGDPRSGGAAGGDLRTSSVPSGGGGWVRKTAWIAAGGAVAGLVVGGLAERSRQREVAKFNDYMALDEAGHVVGRCVTADDARGGGPCQMYYDDLRHSRRVALGASIASGTLLITAVVAFLVSSGDGGAAERATPSLSLGPRDVALNWRF
jgi:hypothetical protein